MLLQFEHLHLNIPPPAKQNPQNLHDLHCFNKDNDTLRELPPGPRTAVVSPEQTAQGRSCPMCRKGPPSCRGTAAGGLGASSLPAHLPWCPACCPASWWELCHRVPHHWTLSILDFASAVISCWHEASFQQHTTTPLHCSSMQTFFQKLSPPTLDLVCSSSKKCSSSNILIVTSQPTLTLLVHSETLFQGFSYHTTGESFQEVSCSKVN